MKKKLFSVIMALVMCLSMLPAMAFAAAKNDPAWQVVQLDAQKGTVISIQDPSKLLADVTAGTDDTCIRIPAGCTFVLDLNGKTLSRGRSSAAPVSDGYVFEVYGTLTIRDTVGGGKITGGNAINGGAIYVAEGGTLNLEGGTISGNKASNNGGGVYAIGTVNLSGGTITGNSADNKGGGLYVDHSCKLGNTAISGNTAGSSLTANMSSPDHIISQSGTLDGLINFFLRLITSIFGR